MSRRIILFGPLPPPYGGVSVYLQALVDHWRDRNVRVWTYGGARPSGSRVRFVAHRKLGTLRALLAEGRGSRILDASHFHLEYPNPLLLAVWLLLKRVLGFEWYKNLHDGSLPGRYQRFSSGRRWWFRQALAAVDRFVVVNQDLQTWLRQLGVAQPIDVIPALLPAPPRPGTEEAQLSASTAALLAPYLAHTKHICSIGVFFPSYGFKDVAEAIAELRTRKGIDIGLLLLDGGFVCDEAYRAAVLRGLDWITVVKEVPHEEVHELLKLSDVFVRAFADESYGLARVEALWAGAPVVATRAGETRGMLLYDFGDREQLIKQLEVALFPPDRAEENPWPARFRLEAEANLAALGDVLGVIPR